MPHTKYMLIFMVIGLLLSIGFDALNQTIVISSTIVIIFTYLLLKFFKFAPITFPNGKSGFRNSNPAIMIILGSGGHTWEMFNVLSRLTNWKYYLPIYITCKSDNHSRSAIVAFESSFIETRPYFLECVTRPKEPGSTTLRSFCVAWRSCSSFLRSIQLILLHRPNYLICNGPSICVPIVLAAWMLNKLGLLNPQVRIIYLESAARIKTLSISTKILMPFVGTKSMFGFWPEFCAQHNLFPLYKISLQESSLLVPELPRKVKITKMVLITVGSTKFDDLVNFVLEDQIFQDTLVECGFTKLVVQVGEKSKTKYVGTTFLETRIVNLLEQETFGKLLEEADMIITHGGAGTLLQALKLRKIIIVVPNPNLIQNHQLELVEHLESLELCRVTSIENIGEVLQKIISGPTLSTPNFLLNYELSEYFRFAIGELELNFLNLGVLESVCQKARQFSIVIPAVYEDSDHLEILLNSLRHFISLDDVANIFVILPDDQVHFFDKISRNNHDEIQFIPETNLVPETILSKCDQPFFLKSRSGWFKQQILKLAAAKLVQTPFYLVLDADCILTRPLGYSDLVTTSCKILPGRAFLQTEEIYRHPRWWEGSAKLLGITKPYMNSLIARDLLVMGVTPAVLSVEVVRKLQSFLEGRFDCNWADILAENRIHLNLRGKVVNWTEYTLYYLFARRSGLLEQYHVTGSASARKSLADYNVSLWKPEEVYEWNPKPRTLNDPPFLIFQSNCKLGARIPAAFLQNIMQPKETFEKITCLMKIPRNANINSKSIIESIRCFKNQSWPKEKRQLLIICQESSERIKLELDGVCEMMEDNETVRIIINKNNHLTIDIDKTVATDPGIEFGQFIAHWSTDCWYSPFRLAIQHKFLQEKTATACYISDYTLWQETEGRPYFAKTEINRPEISLFCKLDRFLKVNPQDIPQPLADQPNMMVQIDRHVNVTSSARSRPNDLNYTKMNFNSAKKFSVINQLIAPFCDKMDSTTLHVKPMMNVRRIYIVSSEFDFKPVIGGINTFLRVIISTFQEIQESYTICANIQLVFCGLKCGVQEGFDVRNIPGVTFKFFQTPKSVQFSNLELYFKSFEKFSSLSADLKCFGAESASWILNDAQPGDICLTTITFEWSSNVLEKLVKGGLKIVHTVHSLVPLKTLATARCPPLQKLSTVDYLRYLLVKHIRLTENKLSFIANHSWSRWILPKFLGDAICTERKLMELCSAVFVPSKKLTAITVALFPTATHKIRYIPWGIPCRNVFGEDFEAHGPITAAILNGDTLEPQTNPNRIITCLALCKIIPQKGVDLLLDALVVIEKLDIEIAAKLEVNIAGDMAYMTDTTFLKEIQAKSANLKFLKVNFTGWLCGKRKLELMSRSDIFLSPSLSEPFGFSLLEAMKSGMAILSFATEGPVDLVSHKFGILIDLSDNYEIMIQQFALGIIALSQDSGKLEKMKEAARIESGNWRMNGFFENLFSI